MRDYLRKRLSGAGQPPAVVLTETIPASPVEKIFRALRKLGEPVVEAAPACSRSSEALDEKLVELSARRAKLSSGKRDLLEKRLHLLQQQRNHERV